MVTDVNFKRKYKFTSVTILYYKIEKERELSIMKQKISITNAEFEVMNVLWDKKSATMQDILLELSKEKTRNRNTIKTLLFRLIDKNLVESRNNDGKKTYEYYPLIEKEEYISQENHNFLQKLYGGCANNLVLNFVKENKLSKKDLEELVKILED